METRNCGVGTTDEKKYKVEEYQTLRANKKKKKYPPSFNSQQFYFLIKKRNQ